MAMGIFNRLRASVSRQQKSSITMALHVIRVEEPILIENHRQHGKAFYGYWDQEEKVWHWGLQEHPYPEDTHYLPTNTELLPVRCCQPKIKQ